MSRLPLEMTLCGRTVGPGSMAIGGFVTNWTSTSGGVKILTTRGPSERVVFVPFLDELRLLFRGKRR